MADHEILEIAKTIRYDLTALQGKLSELMRMAAELPEPDEASRPRCPSCGIKFKGVRALAVHTYQMHDGPEPAHWLEAEQRAAL